MKAVWYYLFPAKEKHMEETSESGKTRWHRLPAKLFEELLTPTGS